VGVRQRKFEEVHALLEAPEVFGPAEGPAASHEQRFPHRVAKKKSAVKDRHHRLCFGDEFAVEKNDHGGRLLVVGIKIKIMIKIKKNDRAAVRFIRRRS
jgi:hypothetical protein